MRRLLISAVAVCLAFYLEASPAAARFASIVVDAKTGRILHAVNAETRNYPASLTKIMTLYMTFEALRDGRLKVDQKLTTSRVAASRSPSRLGLRRGEEITVDDAIAALVTKSANDVATVLAEAIGGTERKFARMMTERAHALGMTETVFKNASGLPNRGQLSTAKDMAILARAILRHFPNQYAHFSRKTFTFRGRTYRNHNHLMKRYQGMDGIKTGYIRASGFNLVASAERNGRRLIAVVFGGKSPKWRDRHMAGLLDKGFGATGNMASAALKALPAPKPRPEWAGSGKVKPTVVASNAPMSAAVAAEAADDRTWAVQVGVYNRYAPAHLAATRAARAVPDLLGKQVRIIRQNTRRRGVRLYKARLMLASKTKADQSCRALKERKIDCMVIRMGPES